jgi:anaerobic magnesium-protoporphyrin IX monomethyl ester cyclase
MRTIKNVVLLQPQVGDMDLFRDRPTPPLGLLSTISGVWPTTEVRLIDQRLGKGWRQRLGAALDSETIAVGVTSLTGSMIRNALDMVGEARRLRDIPIVWGGVHASLLPEQTLLHPLVDYVVEGEGEIVFARLLEALARGVRSPDLPGVWRKACGRVIGTHRGPLLDVKELPMVPFSAVDMESYIQTLLGQRTFFFQASRGCPFQCTYCYNQVFNERRWRAFPAERVVDELGTLRRTWDFTNVYFVDDDFFIDRSWAMKILTGLRDLGIKSVLQGVDVLTLSRMSDEELDFIETAGVQRISVGVESGVDRVRRDVLKKRGDIELVRNQLRRFSGRQMGVLCSFMMGFPSETRDEIRHSLEFGLEILSLGDNFRLPQFYNYIPYPGTELCAVFEAQGFRFPTRLEDWGRWEYDFSVALPRSRVVPQQVH